MYLRCIIGLGTGRCGTRSLAKLLNAKHEQWYLPWKFDESMLQHALRKIVGIDIGYYWLNYVDWVAEKIPESKFICIRRPKESVVASFMKSSGPLFENQLGRVGDNVSKKDFDAMDESTKEWISAYWGEPLGVPDKYFPDYGLGKEASLLKYCEEYNEKTLEYNRKYPKRFLMVDMDYGLNTREGRDLIFNFIGGANGRRENTFFR